MPGEKVEVGVLYLEKKGDVRSAKIIYVEVDTGVSSRKRLFTGLRAVPEGGEFFCCFDDDADIYFLKDPAHV